MKRALESSPNDTEPPKKRHKPNTAPSTPPISDTEDKPAITKSSTTASNASTSSSESDEDNECCICFGKKELPIKLDCGHQFCFLCIKEIRMQTQPTFNLANLNCNTPNSDDEDEEDEDGDTNTNRNNTNRNRTKKKSKPVEKFSCPYCRREFDVTVIDKATMKKTDWINTKKKAGEEVIIWQYSGRKGGWWAYQKGHKKQLEKGYQKFLKALKDEQEKEEKAQRDMEEDKDKRGKYDTRKCKDDGDDEEEDDLGEEEGLLSHQCMIEIGVRKYVCDFAQMIQFDHEFPTRKRRIRRRVETKHSLEKSDSLKGCAGKFFNDGDKNKEKDVDKDRDKKKDGNKNKNRRRRKRNRSDD